MNEQTLILASQSPRRAEMLRRINVRHTTKPADIEERLDQSRSFEQNAQDLSLQKALAIQPEVGENDLILASDTIVVVESTVFGKPSDEAEARMMLNLLSDRTHTVYTGVALCCGDKQLTAVSATEVTFRELTSDDITRYLATDESMDKAGGYGIQGYASLFVQSISGSHDNVMGLPLHILPKMFTDMGLDIHDFMD